MPINAAVTAQKSDGTKTHYNKEKKNLDYGSQSDLHSIFFKRRNNSNFNFVGNYF